MLSASEDAESVSSTDAVDSTCTDPLPGDQDGFDFEGHQNAAEDQYRRIRGTYEDFAKTVKELLERALSHGGVLVHSIEARAKEIDSFGKKAATPDPNDPDEPKYKNPIQQITDLTAARVITFFLSALNEVDHVITEQFDIVERNDRGGEKGSEARLGYQSIHYLVKIKHNRIELPEYARFNGLVAELQVRTILQHAWAEIEHEIQYKAVDVLPKEIQRRFLTLAGMLEIGDREFQALEDAHQKLLKDTLEQIASGSVEDLELTKDSLKALLDNRLGEDRRMRDWSYTFATRTLKRLGFTTIKQVDHALTGYDHDRISRIIHPGGSRQGQIRRFESVILASMGQNYIERHPWAQHDWFNDSSTARLNALQRAGITIGNYDPLSEG